ncbi:MAG: hypothetical protein KDJ52_26760 [Anaerolineae bacterium]|nr:hypothetical protein [Anaerolineae bacterium]
MNLNNVVERIKQLPEAYVDCNFGQGRDTVLKQLEERSGENEEYSVDLDIESAKNSIQELIERFAPYEIPGDYISFLEVYGGLAIDSDNSYFSILGTGPMVEDWYGSIDGHNVFWELEKQGFLTLGSLNFRRNHQHKFQYLSFFLDLAAIVQKDCVIGVGPWGAKTLTPIDIIPEMNRYSDKWRIFANSFTEWLAQAAETDGGFGF